MGQLKWYKRDPSAALNGMMELTLEERGAYNTVLDLIYSRDGNLADDDRFIAGWMRVDLRVWKRIRSTLIERGKLFVADGILRNERADVEVLAALKRVGSAADAGRASAASKASKSVSKSRKSGDLDATGVETGVPTGVSTNHNHNQNTLDTKVSNAASAATNAPHSDDQNPGDEKGKSSTTPPPAEDPPPSAEDEPNPPRLTAKDITKVIFDSGIALLVGAGCREPQARSIIGKWRKEYHDSIVLAALSRAQAQDDISQPIEWMTRALIRERQRAAGENHGPVQPTRPSLVDIGRAVADDLRAERGLP